MRSRRTLPSIIVVFMLLAAMHVMAGTVYASGVSCAPLVIKEGFNADGVFEKDGKADHMDNERSKCCFFADPDREGSLPANGIIETNGGRYFKLGKYDQSNFLRLEVNKRGSLSFDEKSCIASKTLSFLVTGCDSGGTVTATVHFADTDETMTGQIVVPDWDAGIGRNAVYRCGRYSMVHAEYDGTDDYGLYERTIDIPAELQGYNVTSIDLELTSWNYSRSTVCVFAVTATPVADTRCVIYDENGGSLIFSPGVDSVPVGKKITLPQAVRGEDALDGWYDGETKVGAAEGSYTVSDNVVLRAKWKTEYILAFLYEDSTIPQKLYKNEDGTYEHPQREYYTFKGFSQTQDGEPIDESALVPGNTYYAVWEEAPSVTIRFGSLGDRTIHLDGNRYIIAHESLPQIGTKFSEDMVLEGYYSDTEYTKPVDVHSPIPQELFGKTIYAKLGEPSINEKGADGTAVGAGASAAAAEKAIMNATSDEGPKGTKYAPLRLRSTRQTGSYVRLTWTRAKGAANYVIYGNLCGKKNRMKKLASVSGSAGTIKTISGKKLGKGKYYKFIIVALDKNDKVVSTSKVIHVATGGGKVGNDKSVTVSKTVIAKAKKLKKGKSLKLNAKAVKASKLAVKKHRAVSYESSDPKIAAVSRKGVVKGKKKGTCYIYAYAQNGVFKKIKVVVK